jgi:hypothetical protein
MAQIQGDFGIGTAGLHDDVHASLLGWIEITRFDAEVFGGFGKGGITELNRRKNDLVRSA